nr:nickel pincer cofactor biosynthesis protein LarC [Lachnospiraceae bacterium]
SMADIEAIINHLNAPLKVRKDAINVYKIIAEAESKAHGTDVSMIHFHEVGMKDAIADVTAVCLLMDELAFDKVIVSPVNTGFGEVKCAHGIMPVPAPATANILMGVPFYKGDVKGELCTPTGAALIKYFADDFGLMPVMNVSAIGYGFGNKEFKRLNCMRAIAGETEGKKDEVILLSCNIDDMTAEELSYASSLLMEEGARDVYTTAIGMKKGRQGTLLTLICSPSDKEKFAKLIFKHTSTIGIRELAASRYILEREQVRIGSPYGDILAKRSFGYGTDKIKYEYEDLAKLARENNKSIEEIKRDIKDIES